ncbi:cytochrome P450 [Cryptosporangium aurantiacum]|uniref:Cytochrome P450 n=1 Tax=Cryptosporangium aurantiacum TaxID=134849 RepID=A0A1M7P897_9ACTN|nr:cytochrome P450 [Cryptosporangium aurantiacum]SHN12423.1 hypothetical protein SAMN05443668_10317 [Cryptosporangium aurantiacum]
MVSELAASFDPLGAHYDDPYGFYARARRDEPVFYSPRLDAWVVTRFADVDAVLKDPTAFSSVNSLRPIRAPYPAALAVLATGYPQTPDHVTSDGVDHRRLRTPYAKHLTTPGFVKGREAAIRQRADTLIGEFDEAGHADLIAQYATLLPAATAGELFGFAPDDIPVAKAGSEALFSLGSADLTEDEEARAAETVVAFQQLLAEYARRRRAAPTGDLMSDVVAALAPGDDPLTYDQEAELVGTFGSTFGASHITTADGIGSALRLLLSRPDQWELLCRKPELAPYAVEEVLRFEAPIPAMFRRVSHPATVAGVKLPEGADVLLAFASANRDEDRYPDADRFDVTRTPSRHFAFGAGIHTCVGAAMARLQMRIALQTLIERLPGLRLAPDQHIEVRRSINVRGPLALEARW